MRKVSFVAETRHGLKKKEKELKKGEEQRKGFNFVRPYRCYAGRKKPDE